jgi:hypothetical protein
MLSSRIAMPYAMSTAQRPGTRFAGRLGDWQAARERKTDTSCLDCPIEHADKSFPLTFADILQEIPQPPQPAIPGGRLLKDLWLPAESKDLLYQLLLTAVEKEWITITPALLKTLTGSQDNRWCTTACSRQDKRY